MRVEAYTKVNQLYQATKPKKLENRENGVKNDKLEISEFGKEFQIAKKAAMEAPEFREDKVDAIRNALREGTYQVSVEDVADKLLEGYFRL